MSAEEIQRYYARTLFDYDVVWGLGRNHAVHVGYYDDATDDHDAAVENMNRVVADAVGVQRGDRVLDAGCGVGGSSVWLAEHRDAEVVGINITEAHLERARDLAAERGLDDRVTFARRDFTDTGFPDDSFDVVWGIEAVCHADDTAAFLAEAARVLRPGGRLVVADRFATERDLSARDRREMNHWLDGWAIPHLAHRDDFLAAAERAGFEDVGFRDVTEATRPSARRMFMASAALYPGSRVLEAVGLRDETETGNVLAGYYQYLTLQRGLWAHGIVTARRPADAASRLRRLVGLDDQRA